jgi:hypothetical protein
LKIAEAIPLRAGRLVRFSMTASRLSDCLARDLIIGSAVKIISSQAASTDRRRDAH